MHQAYMATIGRHAEKTDTSPGSRPPPGYWELRDRYILSSLFVGDCVFVTRKGIDGKLFNVILNALNFERLKPSSQEQKY